MIERGAARRRLWIFVGAISRGLWTALIHHAAGPSVCVGVGVSRTRKWVLLHSIIHRACARGPASVLTAPPGPPRSSRRTWRIVGPDEDVPRETCFRGGNRVARGRIFPFPFDNNFTLSFFFLFRTNRLFDFSE